MGTLGEPELPREDERIHKEEKRKFSGRKLEKGRTVMQPGICHVTKDYSEEREAMIADMRRKDMHMSRRVKRRICTDQQRADQVRMKCTTDKEG